MRNDQAPEQNIMRYNSYMLEDRTINELIGLAKGIVADSAINKEEGFFLLAWLERNAKHASDQIINKLFFRIKEMLSDNVLDSSEQEELLTILKSITGEQLPASIAEATAATFPLNIPPPPLIIKEKYFCLTGKFAYGPRRICEEAIIERGGKVKNTVSDWVDYLVIGSLCSDQWAHTSYGRKIEEAILRRDDSGRERTYGEKIAIIHEDHWAKFMFFL